MAGRCKLHVVLVPMVVVADVVVVFVVAGARGGCTRSFVARGDIVERIGAVQDAVDACFRAVTLTRRNAAECCGHTDTLTMAGSDLVRQRVRVALRGARAR